MSLLSPSRSAKTSPSVGFKKIAKDRACWFDFACRVTAHT
jgi:hypothetical protein